MNSTDKGNTLENAFYGYLLAQKEQGELVFGLYPANLCNIFHKKKYACSERGSDVEFDVVIEVVRPGGSRPTHYIVFECKNYVGNIPEIYVNDFSIKLSRIFKHAAKGVMVVSSQLQSGAENVAKNSGMAIVKYDDNGTDIIADRKGRSLFENNFVRKQLFENQRQSKSLKFSAFFDGAFFGELGELLKNLDPETCDHEVRVASSDFKIPYVSNSQMKNLVQEILRDIDYLGGAVDLEKVCEALSIKLEFTDKSIVDADGNLLLGSANFNRGVIQIHAHAYKNRERFTLSHEIGHFCLKHGDYLKSEIIVERDLTIGNEKSQKFNYDRLEAQANMFASHLILPDERFIQMTAIYRRMLDVRDRTHGYIYVDDQPCNYIVYDELLSKLSTYFQASNQVVELKLKKLNMLTDQRGKEKKLDAPQALANFVLPQPSFSRMANQ